MNNKLLVIISADGAENVTTQEGGANIISFNVIIINKKLQEANYTSTQILNILTFLQVCGDEKQDLCCTVFEEVLKSINKFKSEDLLEKYQHLNFGIKHMNDGKMIYALIQCSDYNRKHHPFIACKYHYTAKGECQRMMHKEYGILYCNSEKKMKADLKKLNVTNLDELEDDKQFKK